MAVGRQADQPHRDPRFGHPLTPFRPNLLHVDGGCASSAILMPFELNHPPGATRRPGPRELTAMLALLMALNAFAIDAMVPALPDIGRSLQVAVENRRQ